MVTPELRLQSATFRSRCGFACTCLEYFLVPCLVSVLTCVLIVSSFDQIWTCYVQKSGEGLSLVFLAIWLAGDLTNLLGSFWQELLPTGEAHTLLAPKLIHHHRSLIRLAFVAVILLAVYVSRTPVPALGPNL